MHFGGTFKGQQADCPRRGICLKWLVLSGKRGAVVAENHAESGELYISYKPLLFSLAYRMLGSVMDAEDIVHEAFLNLNKAGFEHVHDIKSYLCKIARTDALTIFGLRENNEKSMWEHGCRNL
jgi:hypothetical protein